MNKAYKYFVYFMVLLWIIMIIVDLILSLEIYKLVSYQFYDILYPVFIIVPFPLLLFYFPGVFTFYYMIFLLLIVAVFYIYSLFDLSNRKEKSALFKIAEFFALNLFLSILYIQFVNYIHEPISNPFSSTNIPFSVYFVSLTNAGLYEELITRVLYIGIPLFIYYRYKGVRLPWYRIVWGGNYKLGAPEVTVWVISSIIFGIAHSTAWDWSKTPQAMLGGFLLGYLYLRYGLFADVLFHYSIDASDAILTNAINSPVANIGTESFLSLEYLIFLVGGFVVAIDYIYVLVTKGYKNKEDSENKALNFQYSFNCPKCGSNNSKLIYDDIYKCNDCGQIYRKSS